MQVRQPSILTRQATRTTVCKCICIYKCVDVHVCEIAVTWAIYRKIAHSRVRENFTRPHLCHSPHHHFPPNDTRPVGWANYGKIRPIFEGIVNIRPLVGEFRKFAKGHSPTYIYVYTYEYIYVYMMCCDATFISQRNVSIKPELNFLCVLH